MHIVHLMLDLILDHYYSSYTQILGITSFSMKLSQSIGESVFQSVPGFSHVQ